MPKTPLALIIEDDPKLSTIFAETLKMAEFETETIADGQVALERLTTIVPDVVVLDLHLPQVSGREILHQIRADERLAHTRVMVVTADAAMADSLGDAADLSLLKPVSIHQLHDLATRLRPPDTTSA